MCLLGVYVCFQFSFFVVHLLFSLFSLFVEKSLGIPKLSFLLKTDALTELGIVCFNVQ